MAKFLNTKSLSSGIDSLISEASEELYLISPYLKISEYYLDRLQIASNKGVQITVIYREEKDINLNTLKRLKALKNVKIAIRPKLHAKCYFNEKTMIITSINLHEFSENFNDEMGVLIKRYGSDAGAYRDARNEIEIYLGLAMEKSNTHQKWHCIRCSVVIPKNLKRPYCEKCFNIWNTFRNRNWIELDGVCHQCGESFESSVNNPLCDKCSKITKH